jgi:hypothetical protein
MDVGQQLSQGNPWYEAVCTIIPRVFDGADIRAVEQCPEGYPRLAAFLDSDENFMLYRRFGFLQARILLYKQDELRELETDLDRMDKIDKKKAPAVLKSRERDDAENTRRKELLHEIEERFKEYGPIHLNIYKHIYMTDTLSSSPPHSSPKPCRLQSTTSSRLPECEGLLR